MQWRTHPKLAGRFPPEHPDDLQVIVHDGGPRTTDRRPEAVWVTVTGCDGDVFTGRVLNVPLQLVSVRQGKSILFVMPDGAELPMLVTEKYLRERAAWNFLPCEKCGLSELFDAPSDLMRVAFPNLPPGAVVEMFTTFCPGCGAVRGVELSDPDRLPVADAPAERPWWKFWSR